MTSKIRYLSDEWLVAADRQLEALSPVSGPVEVGMTVLDGPDGDRLYRLILGPDRGDFRAAPECAVRLERM